MRGRVLLGDGPFAAAPVIVHRVGPDASEPLDTLRTGLDGGFRFRLQSVPNPAVREGFYFASVEHGGVNYFGRLIQTAAELDSLYVIQAYESEVAPEGGASIDLTARYILLEEQPDIGWTATDLMHLTRTGSRTLIARPDGATFVYPLPEGASDLEVGGNQMAPDAAELVDGNLRVTSAIPPGEREFVVRYRVLDPFVTVPYPGSTHEAELLVRQPAPALQVEGLRAAPAVEMEPGSSYLRFAGTDLRDATVAVRRDRTPRLPLRWVAVTIAFLLASIALFSVLRPHPAVAGQSGVAAGQRPELTPFERRQMLLLEIARLDEARDAAEIPDPEEWAARRRALLERLGELG